MRRFVVLCLGLMVLGVLVLVGCGDEPPSSGQSQADNPLVAVGSLAEAEAASRQVVDDTVARFLPDYPTSDDGLGEHPCDPIENGEVRYDYDLKVDVPADMVEDATVQIWEYWQREYGFEPHSQASTFEPPVVRAGSNGFGGSITGDPERNVVFVGVSSPCFPADG